MHVQAKGEGRQGGSGYLPHTRVNDRAMIPCGRETSAQKGGVDLRTGALMEGVSRVADAHVSRGLYP